MTQPHSVLQEHEVMYKVICFAYIGQSDICHCHRSVVSHHGSQTRYRV